MKNISVLIKPASSLCNLNCDYCFYNKISDERKIKSYGLMTLETLETIVKKVIEESESFCGFAFQGGEPTLVGLDFYKKLIELQKKYNTKNIQIHNSIQTNGYNLNEDWAKFFAENKFLVGLSLDGNKKTHNAYRKNISGENSFDEIMKTVELFKKHKVDFNILTVVTDEISKNSQEVYNFFKENNFDYLQFIPLIQDRTQAKNNLSFGLTQENYTDFLIKTLDIWHEDMLQNKYISVRTFDNYVNILLGRRPEACDMIGVCSMNFVVESNGDIYPCDFYVKDDYKIGNILENSFAEIIKNPIAQNFVKDSMNLHEKCKSCKWINLCRTGCRRNKEPVSQNKLELNYYCESYQKFFENSYEKLKEVAEFIYKNN